MYEFRNKTMSPQKQRVLATGQETVKYMSNMTESRICQNCKLEFMIEPDDFLFYLPALLYVGSRRVRK